MSQSKLYASPNRPSPAPRKYSRRHQTRSSQSRSHSRGLIFGSLILAALALAPQDLWTRLTAPLSEQTAQSQTVQSWQFDQATTAQACKSMLNADQRLSRDQLSQFLSLPKESAQTTIHQTIAPPYCTLSKAHQAKQSEAYPLAFDPDTWFVVNYEQGSYKGYDFVFRR